jgi:hypothetical protein
MCRTSVEFARKFDNSNKLDLLDFHATELREQFPDITLEALMKELHVVDDRGNVWRGAARSIGSLASSMGYAAHLPGSGICPDSPG